MKKLIPLGFGLSPLVFGLVIMKLCALYSNSIIIIFPIWSITFLALWYFLGYWSVRLTKKPASSFLLLNLPLFIFAIGNMIMDSLGTDLRYSLLGEFLYVANVPLLGLAFGLPVSGLSHIIAAAVSWLGCNRACHFKKTGE